MDVGQLARLVVIDLAVVIVFALVIGGSAPHWPARWLARDIGPLRLTRLDTVVRYRRLGVPWLARVLPEGGEWMGGESKSALPGMDAESMERYAIEVRRGEWVHILTMLAWVPLAFFNPWWLTLLFGIIVIVTNGVFLLVLRYNRVRITAILSRYRR